jgi:ribosomal protein S18 acetylase RimI-like enzyme
MGSSVVVFLMRDAAASDYDDFVRLFAELKVSDPVPTQERFASEIAPHTVYCIESGQRLAYAFWKKYGNAAHVVHLAVASGHRGRGVGRAVMSEVATRASAAGCATWYLNVKKDNVVAIALYQRCGMRMAFESVLVELPWANLPRLPAGSAARAFDVDVTSDRLVEETFALPTGVVASRRAVPECALIAMREQERVVGFAAFDPAFPGASPFRVASPQHALPLLEAVRPRARREHAFVRLSIENDAELAATLRAAGAIIVHELARMTGNLE